MIYWMPVKKGSPVCFESKPCSLRYNHERAPAGDGLWQAWGNMGFEWSRGHTSIEVTHFQDTRCAILRQTVYSNYLLTGNRIWIWKAWNKQALLLLALSQSGLPRRQGSEINRCRGIYAYSPYASSLIRNTKSWARKQHAPSVGWRYNRVGCLKTITGLFDYEKSLKLINYMNHGDEVINNQDIMWLNSLIKHPLGFDSYNSGKHWELHLQECIDINYLSQIC